MGWVAPLILCPTSGETALHVAVAYNTRETVEALLAASADINAVNKLGRTPLAKAVVAKKGDAVAWLLEAGADRSIADNSGKRPTDHATEAGVPAIVDLLSSAGDE